MASSLNKLFDFSDDDSLIIHNIMLCCMGQTASFGHTNKSKSKWLFDMISITRTAGVWYHDFPVSKKFSLLCNINENSVNIICNDSTHDFSNISFLKKRYDNSDYFIQAYFGSYHNGEFALLAYEPNILYYLKDSLFNDSITSYVANAV